MDREALQVRWRGGPLWNIASLFSKSTSPASVEVISGACMMVRRKVFEKAGLFSEDYFMYAEDLDLCHKVRGLGLKNYYVGRADVVHHGGNSSSQKPGSQWSTPMKMNSVTKFCSLPARPGWASAASISLASSVVINHCVMKTWAFGSFSMVIFIAYRNSARFFGRGDTRSVLIRIQR